MKNWILKTKILAFVAFLLFSCNKSNLKKIDALSDLTKEVLAKRTLQEMKQGHALLSVEERDILWNTKLDKILSNTRESFTIEQRKIVLELSTFLKKYGMKKLMLNPEIGVSFLNEKLPYYSAHFNKEQLNILIESPYLTDDLLISKINWEWMKPFVTPKANDKQQNLVQLMVVGGTETGSCTCIYDMGCPGPGNKCENTGCVVESSYEMCGLFGTSNCKRRCSGAEPNLNPDPNGGNPL